MARSRAPRGGSTASEPDAPPAPPFLDYPGETTGRFLVLYKEGATAQAVAALKDAAGLSAVASTADAESGALTAEQVAEADLLVFDKLGVAVVAADPAQAAEVMSAAADEANDLILAVEPERVVRALAIPVDELAGPAGPADPHGYMTGYRDAVNFLYDKLFGGGGGPAGGGLVGPEAAFFDTPTLTWGLQATRAGASRFSGQGVRVAVLDTGFDLQHPDFVGRPVVAQSFVPGQAVQDGHGHGTHCIGTACGPLRPPTGVRRYGCAHAASIFAGKVLSNAGSGSDAGILNGINWAITNGCRVVSMSLGAPVGVGQPFSQVFETAARRALAANTLIIAAAGNSSRVPNTNTRRVPPNPVGHPANCPSIMAVAAVDNRLGIAAFSDGGINPNGGGVDIAGPGVAVFSSVPAASGRHAVMSGTSMATPHVAGIAAMHLQARGLRTTAQALWQILTSTALRLPLPARDVGAGLVQAPV